MEGPRAARLTHPLLRLEVIRPDGTRTASHRVYCARGRRSVSIDACCACVHCERVASEPRPAVVCTIDVDERDDLDVGAVVREGAVVVVDERGAAVVVMDEAGVPASSALALHERTPVRTALRLLAAAELRAAMVVDDRGVPLGVFRVTDVLHDPLARTRTA